MFPDITSGGVHALNNEKAACPTNTAESSALERGAAVICHHGRGADDSPAPRNVRAAKSTSAAMAQSIQAAPHQGFTTASSTPIIGIRMTATITVPTWAEGEEIRTGEAFLFGASLRSVAR